MQRQGAELSGSWPLAQIPLFLAHGVCGPGGGTRPTAYTLLALAEEFESTATWMLLIFMWCRVRALLIWTSVVEDPWSLILRGLFLWYNLASSTCEPLLREAVLLCDLSHGSASLAMGSYEAQTEFLWCQTTELMPGLVGPEWRYVIFCFSPHWLWKLPTNVAYLLSCMTANKCTSAALPSKILSLAVPFWFL